MPEAVEDQHHFDFDLDRGIRTQVVEKFSRNGMRAGLESKDSSQTVMHMP
jgi:hypothetical protein